MLRYKIGNYATEFIYDHDTRRWGTVVYRGKGDPVVLQWRPLGPYDDENALEIPQDYADWLPDN